MSAVSASAAQVIAAHQNRVFRFILKAVGNRGEAEELTQQTLIEALRAHARYRRESSFTTWLFGIALNIVRAHGRARRRELAQVSEDALIDLPHHDDDPETAFARQQEVRRLQAAIAALPEELKEAVVLVSLEELSYEDAAAVIGASVGAVRSRLFRARRVLREQLTENSVPRFARASPRRQVR